MYSRPSRRARAGYEGFWLATEFHHRWLPDFEATGPLPIAKVFDHGLYLQGSYIFKPAKAIPCCSEAPEALSELGAVPTFLAR